MTTEKIETIKEDLEEILGKNRVKVIVVNKFFTSFDLLKEFLEIAEEFPEGYDIEKYNCDDIPLEFKVFTEMKGYNIAWVKEEQGTSYNLVCIAGRWYEYYPEKRELRNLRTPEPGSLVLI